MRKVQKELESAKGLKLEWGGEARLTAEVTPGATPMGGVLGTFFRDGGGPPHGCSRPHGVREPEKSLFSWKSQLFAKSAKFHEISVNLGDFRNRLQRKDVPLRSFP